MFARQAEMLGRVAPGKHSVKLISFDETEFELRTNASHAPLTESVMTMRGRLAVRGRDGAMSLHEVMLPAAVLEDTRAVTLGAALDSRTSQLPQREDDREVTVYCSDSAKSCIKVARLKAAEAKEKNAEAEANRRKQHRLVVLVDGEYVAKVGPREGDEVAVGHGGDAVGEAVEDTVGNVVGDAVDVAVGDVVGDAVGVSVGVAVGAAAGAMRKTLERNRY